MATTLRPALPPEAIPHIKAAGRVLAQATADLNRMTPKEIALAAYSPSGPSLEELEAMAYERKYGTPSTQAAAA